MHILAPRWNPPQRCAAQLRPPAKTWSSKILEPAWHHHNVKAHFSPSRHSPKPLQVGLHAAAVERQRLRAVVGTAAAASRALRGRRALARVFGGWRLRVDHVVGSAAAAAGAIRCLLPDTKSRRACPSCAHGLIGGHCQEVTILLCIMRSARVRRYAAALFFPAMWQPPPGFGATTRFPRHFQNE